MTESQTNPSSDFDLDAQFEKLEKLLEGIPKIIARKAKKDLKELRELLLDRRDPRFALVGRRGSGKSSLINAILGEQALAVGHEGAMTGEAEWVTYKGQHGAIDLLDTRGLQEGSTPDQEDAAASPIQSIMQALREQSPDVILFVIKASEVDAAIDGDLDGLESVLDQVEEVHGYRVPVFGVVTQCDHVEPKNIKLHAPDDQHPGDLREKEDRIQRIEKKLKDKLASRKPIQSSVVGVMGIAAYQSWRDDGSRRDDERWRVPLLVETLSLRLPNEAKVIWARTTQVKSVQRSLAGKVSGAAAVVCGAIGAAPNIPGGDILPITGTQLVLVTSIGYIAGRGPSLESARDFLGALGLNSGAGFALREGARQLIKIFPGAGNAISGAIAFGATVGIGRAASAFYIDRASEEEVRRIYKSASEEAKEGYDESEIAAAA